MLKMNTGGMAVVIRERMEQIEQDAPCVGCGATLTSCLANRGKDPTAPPWFGCCARGTAMAPCSHEKDAEALAGLLREIADGTVRTVAEVEAERRPRGAGEILAQGVWWRQRSGQWKLIAEMSPGHRYNAAAMLLRNGGEVARAWLRGTVLYRSLTAGLTVAGDGTEPWERTGRDPVTGEPCEVPPRLPKICMDDSCGCSGEAHA